MALTRAQLLMGNCAQGCVLPGQVQGVKQGNGVCIASDGTISFFAGTSEGVVKTNNPTAFNNYIWPNTIGNVGDQLTQDGTGGLYWDCANGGNFIKLCTGASQTGAYACITGQPGCVAMTFIAASNQCAANFCGDICVNGITAGLGALTERTNVYYRIFGVKNLM